METPVGNMSLEHSTTFKISKDRINIKKIRTKTLIIILSLKLFPRAVLTCFLLSALSN